MGAAGAYTLKHHFTPYRHGDAAFREVESFLSESAGRFAVPRNWFIDRWNFTFSVSRLMHRASVSEWESCIGLWRDDAGRIAAMSHEEEQNGDVFFQFADPETETEELLEEMFDFAEAACLKPRSGGLGFGLRIPRGDGAAARIAGNRGYLRGDWSEPLSSRSLKGAGGADILKARPLPDGDCRLVEGAAVDPERKALAHAKAFGYYGTDGAVPLEAVTEGFAALRETPSYREDLDLALEDSRGNILCFAGFWLDRPSRLGIFEPLGTVPERRRRGLAGYLIDEGARRLAACGAETLYVGSDQAFYLASGFSVIARQDVWEYRKEAATNGES